MQDRPYNNKELVADHNKLVDIEKSFHEQSEIIEDIIDEKKSLTRGEMSQYLVTLTKLTTQIIRVYKKYAADELSTIANANESESESESEIEMDDAQRILDLLKEIQDSIDITFDAIDEYEKNISSPDKDKGEEIKLVKPTKSTLNSPAASIQIAGTTQKVTADITLKDLENLNQLPENQQERTQKIVEQILFAMDMIEDGLQIDNSNQLIQMNNFPRNLQKAIIAYCTHMGYAYQSNVKFNTGEKDAMIANFITHLDNTPDLKQRIDEKKQAMLAAKQEPEERKMVPAEAVKAKTERVIEITLEQAELINTLKQLENEYKEAAYKDKDNLKKALIEKINQLSPDDLYAITLKLFEDHVSNNTDQHLLRSDEGIKKYAYVAFAKMVGYDLKAKNEKEAFSAAPDKPCDPRMDDLNWYVRKSMGSSDDDSVCSNVVFCVIGGVRHDINRAVGAEIMVQANAIEFEKKQFLAHGQAHDAYVKFVVNDTVKQAEPPVKIDVSAQAAAILKQEKAAPALARRASTEVMQPVVAPSQQKIGLFSGVTKLIKEKKEKKEKNTKDTRSAPRLGLFKKVKGLRKTTSAPSPPTTNNSKK